MNNMIPNNITNFSLNLYNTSTYNTGCIAEIEKVTGQFTKFKLLVYQTYDTRFLIGFIILFLLVMIKLYITSKRPKFFEENKIGIIIDDKLTLTIILLFVMLIGLLFLI